MFAFLFIYFSVIATVVKSLLVKILSIEQDHQHRLGACLEKQDLRPILYLQSQNLHLTRSQGDLHAH